MRICGRLLSEREECAKTVGVCSRHNCLPGSMATSGAANCDGLTRRHGIKVMCRVSVEECVLAVGGVVGCDSIVSASRMNNAIVLFLNSIEKANEVVQKGIVINNELTPVLPLSSPSRKIVISNVPPFVSDDCIAKELSSFSKLVSPFRKIALGCKSPLLKHVVSFRRQVYMILKNNTDELNLSFNVKVEGFNYIICATSESIMKCFGCNKIGHLIRACPDKIDGIDAAQTNSQSNVSEVVSVTDVVAASIVDESVAEVPVVTESKNLTMAEVVAGTSAVTDSMSSEMAGIKGNTTVLTGNISITDKTVCEVDVEVEMET
ncbi:hypothetical protein M9458_053852, partial [Cirrhinus mrigala]